MAKSIIVCHIAAASGARFSVHPSEEVFRQYLLEYHNDTLCDDDDEKLHDDAVVSEVIDAIEESATVSRSEGRRVGKECVRTCRYRWWTCSIKNKHIM